MFMRPKVQLRDVLLGCRHRHLSFPFTLRPGERRSGAAKLTGTYVVCLKCGKQFAYDWENMCVISSDESEAHKLKRWFQDFVHGIASLIRG